jgi:hypothetical protein
VSAFSKLITPGVSYSAVNAPDAAVPFVPDEYEFANEGGVAVDVSFDGIEDHDRVAAGTRLVHRTKARKVWAKGAGGTLRVMARTDV